MNQMHTPRVGETPHVAMGTSRRQTHVAMGISRRQTHVAMGTSRRQTQRRNQLSFLSSAAVSAGRKQQQPCAMPPPPYGVKGDHPRRYPVSLMCVCVCVCVCLCVCVLTGRVAGPRDLRTGCRPGRRPRNGSPEGCSGRTV